MPAPTTALSPTVFVLRVGKGSYAQLLMTSGVALVSNDLGTGFVTLTWPAVTGTHVGPSEGADGIPPPR